MQPPTTQIGPGTVPAEAIAPRVDDRAARATVIFVALVALVAGLAGDAAPAVYAVGFWHYLLYALAYRFGAVPLPMFKRDAVLAKAVSLLTLGAVYLSVPLDGASLGVVAAGFALNALAAFVLGSDRTYYGYELAGVQPLRVARFPYSVIAHPMLAGNVLAYGGMLLNPEFRESWWPLATAHVGLNLGLLTMERRVVPLRRAADGLRRTARRGSKWPALGSAVTGAALASAASGLIGSPSVHAAAAIGACIAAQAYVLFVVYTPVIGAERQSQPENRP